MISRAGDAGDNNARPAVVLNLFTKPDSVFGLQVGGSVYASTPLGVAIVDGAIESRRRRQVVAPDGRITERLHVDRLALAGAAELEREAEAVGLRAVERTEIPPTDSHVGSTVLILEVTR